MQNILISISISNTFCKNKKIHFFNSFKTVNLTLLMVNCDRLNKKIKKSKILH